MNREKIVKKATEIVVDQLGVEVEKVDDAAQFVNDLGADSLDVIELVMAFEEEFDEEITDEDAEKLKTFGQAVDYVENRLLKCVQHVRV